MVCEVSPSFFNIPAMKFIIVLLHHGTIPHLQQCGSRASLLAGPVVGGSTLRHLKALSIPRIAINPLQLHTQGREIPPQENFFGPLCPATILTQEPQLLLLHIFQ